MVAKHITSLSTIDKLEETMKKVEEESQFIKFYL